MKEESESSSNPNQLELNVNEQKAIDRVFTKKRSRENYCKLNEEKNEILETWFKKIRYPKKEEYEAIAEEINEIVPKIENWFKHKRRKAMIEGNFNLYKRRRLLNEKEKLILEETFRVTMHPNKEKLHELAKMLKFSTKVISNWFSYRRKKFLKVNCFQQTSSKFEKKNFKKKQFSHDGSSPQSINLNGSGSGSDFSLPLGLKNDRQPTTNCTGPSESNTGGQTSSNNNKSENNNENDHPKKMKKIHCEETNRFNSENFHSQPTEFKGNNLDYMKNCQNFPNFFIKNNNILSNMFPTTRQNIGSSYGYTTGINPLQQNAIPQNFYQINGNAINMPNFSNNINRNYQTMYAPVMVMGQDCMLIPVLQQQQLVMSYPTAQPTAFYQNPINMGNGKVNFIQPMMNMNGYYQNNANGNHSMGLNLNHNIENSRMEGGNVKE